MSVLRERMVEALKDSGLDEFDSECAVYWYCADNHAGQSSALYEALSSSPYEPGPMERGPRDLAYMGYSFLQANAKEWE